MINYFTHLRHYKKPFDSALETLKSLKNPTQDDSLRILALENALKVRTNYPVIGRVYTYIYDAIAKKTLPYYDRYPLVLVTSVNIKAHTFFGMNLHYLGYGNRKHLINLILKKLYHKTYDRIMTENFDAVLVGRYHMMYRQAIKQYRFSKVLRLQLREISPILLTEINKVNDETFIHQVLAQVHRISNNKIMNRIR